MDQSIGEGAFGGVDDFNDSFGQGRRHQGEGRSGKDRKPQDDREAWHNRIQEDKDGDQGQRPNQSVARTDAVDNRSGDQDQDESGQEERGRIEPGLGTGQVKFGTDKREHRSKAIDGDRNDPKGQCHDE